MRHHGAMSVLVLVALAYSPAGVRAQAGQKPPAAQAPAAAPAPVHDLSGVWTARRGYAGNTWSKTEPALTPWAQERYKAAKNSNGGAYTLEESNDPVIKKCYPPGVPRIYLQPFPMEIANLQRQIVMLYEYDHTVRRIYIDGREHPKDLAPTYMGHSIGHWDGDTLVVETVGLNDKTWLDRLGHPHSEDLRVVERFHRTDRDTLQIDITMEDSKALAKPWTGQLGYQLRPDWEIMEQVCADNAEFLSIEK